MNLNLFLEDTRLHFQAKAQDLRDFLNYQVLGGKPKKPSYFPEKVRISWRFSPETRTFSAVWRDHPEYFTVSETVEGIITNINDLIFEHFEISRYEARKLGRKNVFGPPGETYQKMLELEKNKNKLRAFEQTTNFDQACGLAQA